MQEHFRKLRDTAAILQISKHSNRFLAQGRIIAARIGDMPIRYQAAKAGLGAAFLPCWLGDSDPDLVQVMKPEGDLIEDVFLVMHRRSRNRLNVTRVANVLAALFKRNQKALVGV